MTTFLLLAVAGALCFSAVKNYQKMNAMEETLAQMNATQSVTTEATEDTAASVSTENLVQVGQVDGNVTKDTETEQAATQTTEAQSGNNASTQSGTTETNGQTAGIGTEAGNVASDSTQTDTTAPATEALTEAETYLSQGYYIVQKGDSLAGICQKIYQTTAVMDKLCEANGIENPDAIYAGQYLTLPN